MTTLPELATWPERWRHFLINAVAFMLCYQISNSLALQHNISRNIALPFETNIPFLEWMIVPYLSSGIFFIWSFVQVKTLNELRVLSQRILLVTVCATLFFVFYPLHFSIIKPEIRSPFCQVLFQFLACVDKPYNQLPSLHVAYSLIFWQSISVTLTNRAQQLLLAICLMLIAVSTVFTYQHHVLDIVSGLLLGYAAIRFIRPIKTEVSVGFYSVGFYSVSFYYAMAACIIFLTGVIASHSGFALYVSLSLFLVCVAYLRKDRFFLRKKNGRHSLLTWLLYGPYLTGYWLTWFAVQYREKTHAAFIQITEQLWIGRRLNISQASLLPQGCTVIDLSPELSKISGLYDNPYWHFPLLDLIQPEQKIMEEIIATIKNEITQGRNVYLHCAMGYSRSKWLANYYLLESNLKKLP